MSCQSWCLFHWQILETLERAEFQLILELWFSEHHVSPETAGAGGASCVSTRTLDIHLQPLKGIHTHFPVLFDYFHLCAVTLTVHGGLLAILQPYIT